MSSSKKVSKGDDECLDMMNNMSDNARGVFYCKNISHVEKIIYTIDPGLHGSFCDEVRYEHEHEFSRHFKVNKDRF